MKRQRTPMTMTEQAICFCAAAHPRVCVREDGGYSVRCSEGVSWLPVAVFYPHFAELINDGILDRVETFPVDMYCPGITCSNRAMEIWKAHGYEPYYVMPGVLLAK
jgi:rhodanese-related sulfurtransferase